MLGMFAGLTSANRSVRIPLNTGSSVEKKTSTVDMPSCARILL